MWGLAAFVVGVAAEGCAGVPGLLEACTPLSNGGWPLLHLAVASGSLRTVEVGAPFYVQPQPAHL